MFMALPYMMQLLHVTLQIHGVTEGFQVNVLMPGYLDDL